MTSPRIVVLDGGALNPGDLSWEPLAACGHCEVHERTAPADIVARCRDADMVLTNKTPLTDDTFTACPGLRYVGVLATGYDCVNTVAARRHGIAVSHVPTYGTSSVAQHTLALMLELARHSGLHAEAVHAGAWNEAAGWSFQRTPQVELTGKVCVLVGNGRIGRAVADLARAFGMEVHCATRAHSREAFAALCRDADVLSLHCPLTPETRGLINRKTLGWLKPTAWLINTSRGALVDESALAAALQDGTLGAAALDVLTTEPPPADHPLLRAPRCLITPHLAWSTTEARQRLLATVAANVRAFLDGRPQHLVN